MSPSTRLPMTRELTEKQAGSIEDAELKEPPSKKRRLQKTPERRPNIINISVTRNQNFAVVVTGEDKCIRVFEITAEGKLCPLSQRSMPKKPCAIAISPDDTCIISADKFGDVYSLPLLPTSEQLEEPAASSSLEVTRTYAPAASESTVHSKANRKALEAQLKQAKDKKQPVKTKETLDFAHELLLGHVSLLTDILVANVDIEEKSRTYILTSDRDEHIRISRGPPQSYIIEGFCLGHTAFVNKICLPEPSLLVSGGGDDELFVWDWLNFKLLKKVDIIEAVRVVRKNLKQNECEEDDGIDSALAVTGFWVCPGPELGKAELMIACEGVPALLHVPIASLSDLKDHAVGFIPLGGNALDVAVLEGGIIVSVDNIHNPGSIRKVNQSEDFKPRLLAYNLIGKDLDGGGVWTQNEDLNQMLVELNEKTTVEWDEKQLQALLYGAENLRKRDHADDHEGEDGPAGEVDESEK